MSKEEFKKFVRKNPNLIKYVNNKNITWQKIYETYELYGENESIWNNYVYENKIPNSFNEIINNIKKIDLEKLQTGIENIQNTISMIQSFGSDKKEQPNNYKYNYQHLDD